MKTVIKWLAATTGAAAVLLFFACNKQNSSNSNPNIPAGKSQVNMYMTDGPGDFFKVLIDIRQISIEIDTASKQKDADHDDEWDDNFDGEHRDADHKSVIWDTLNIKAGVYDLLALRNGVDTLLATGVFPTGKIVKIKITIGSDNTVYIDSTNHFTLHFPGSDSTHTFTINVRREDVDDLSDNDFKMWIDFNVDRSIFFGDGEFFLEPFLQVFNDETGAKVYGTVLPEGEGALVTGYMGTDTIYAIPFDEGSYKFRNVPTGTWSFNFKGRDGYKDTTITGIKVDSMASVKLPTITLHK
ncbi:DUF4382 domain-containing protein [Puia dinghuensis]|uniref:DUF4382 domain-containing protein n=1 Tax=Puia dinghuensis TaxID=1792502 RepID=A0A8J2XTL1_9BACT|nr:DUF4382 domain-containing protein [Puia dinghuensis]GGB04962.1 hypothetical protein GCM10011511_30350 [Puia dinghuensis]